MSREISFDKDAFCGICGHHGAYDVMGDFICPRCLSLNIKRNNGNDEIEDSDEDITQ